MRARLQDRNAITQTASPGESPALPVQNYSNYLRPIETPLVFNGFSGETLQRYASQFADAGIIPVMGIGSASDRKQPEPIEAGSAVSAVLVRGDMDIAATCTVTYVDPQRLLACGHPLLQFGEVDLPMTKATVVATLASPLNAFKIGQHDRDHRRICAGSPERHYGSSGPGVDDDSGDRRYA